MWEQFHHQMSQKLFHSTERTVWNNNLDPNSWCTLYSWAPSPNRYHRPYLHVLGCWEKQIDWVNSHITTQWEREGCHVQQTKEYTSDGSGSERMSALSSAESHTSCVCVRACTSIWRQLQKQWQRFLTTSGLWLSSWKMWTVKCSVSWPAWPVLGQSELSMRVRYDKRSYCIWN